MWRRLSAWRRVEEEVSWSCRDGILIRDKDDGSLQPDTLMIHNVGKIGFHDNVPVGGIHQHLHSCSRIWMKENLLAEIKPCLATVLTPLRPDTLQCESGKYGSARGSLCEARAVEKKCGDSTQWILRDVFFLFLDEFEQLESLESSNMGGEGHGATITDCVDDS